MPLICMSKSSFRHMCIIWAIGCSLWKYYCCRSGLIIISGGHCMLQDKPQLPLARHIYGTRIYNNAKRNILLLICAVIVKYFIEMQPVWNISVFVSNRLVRLNGPLISHALSLFFKQNTMCYLPYDIYSGLFTFKSIASTLPCLWNTAIKKCMRAYHRLGNLCYTECS